MRQKKTICRRNAALLLICALLCTACANSAKATTMHLTRSEGSVDVTDDEGKDVELLEQLGLYSGYQVDTGEESYAWIDLDNVKLTKMDVDSEIEIQKDGKELEIVVKSGGFFFNVTEPLEEDETMNIRNSTMVVGIRGTCGWVAAEDEDRMQVFLLEGKVSCSVKDSEEDAVITDSVSAGEKAELVYDEENGSAIVISELTMSDIPDFVLEEVADTDDDQIQDLLEELEQRHEEEAAKEEEDQKRRDELLSILDGLTSEEAMYAALGDLNGDGTEDLLVFGKHDFSNRVDFCFSGYIWNGDGADYVAFDKCDYLDGFGSTSYGVYWEKATGMLYGQYSFGMDSSVQTTFENAFDSVNLEFNWDYESADGMAEYDEKSRELQEQIDDRFELIEMLEFPVMVTTPTGIDISADFYWTSYWNNSQGLYGTGERPQEMPPFYDSIEDVRRLLSSDESLDDPSSLSGEEEVETEGETEQGTEAETENEIEEEAEMLPQDLGLYFSSGVGAWSTDMTLNRDGSFVGIYHDMDAGSSGDGYMGTCYISDFQGKFENIRKINDYTYSMTLGELSLQEEPGTEWIEEEILYVASQPYGMDGGTEFILYTPDAPLEELPEDFLTWRIYDMSATTGPLSSFGLYNKEMGYGFFGD